MPQTEDCPLGRENKTRIINVEKSVDRIIICVEKLTNHYSNRPSRWDAFVFAAMTTGLVSMVVGLITYIVCK